MYVTHKWNDTLGPCQHCKPSYNQFPSVRKRNACGTTLCQHCTSIVAPVYEKRSRRGGGVVYGCDTTLCQHWDLASIDNHLTTILPHTESPYYTTYNMISESSYGNLCSPFHHPLITDMIIFNPKSAEIFLYKPRELRFSLMWNHHKYVSWPFLNTYVVGLWPL